MTENRLQPRLKGDVNVLLSAPGMATLFNALNNEARFVGGCVRDSLLGLSLIHI